MSFENLSVERLIIHEVYRRLDDRQAVTPSYGQTLLNLSQDARDVFRDRIVSAMGSQSQSMKMTIKPHVSGSAIEIAHNLLSLTDGDFVMHSRRFADKLTEAQLSRNLPGGVIVVFQGGAGNPMRKYVGIVKAETHSGFRRTDDMQVQYFKDLFLTPQTKLYKIGIFTHDGTQTAIAFPDGWEATIYDSHMTSANRDGAALYFYEGFLGCSLPANSAQLTKKFFEETRDFIRNINVSEERKTDLLSGLYTYLKVDQSPVVEVATFSNLYLDPDLSDQYANFMKKNDFPTNAVTKDISDIQGYLRRRKLTFSRNVQLTAPSDAFDDLVQVRTIEGDPEPNGRRPTWTEITVRDRIREQE